MMRYLCILIFSLNLNANFLAANWQVVKFIGESVDDCGGGYSESIAEMCDELQVILKFTIDF